MFVLARNEQDTPLRGERAAVHCRSDCWFSVNLLQNYLVPGVPLLLSARSARQARLSSWLEEGLDELLHRRHHLLVDGVEKSKGVRVQYHMSIIDVVVLCCGSIDDAVCHA